MDKVELKYSSTPFQINNQSIRGNCASLGTIPGLSPLLFPLASSNSLRHYQRVAQDLSISAFQP